MHYTCSIYRSIIISGNVTHASYIVDITFFCRIALVPQGNGRVFECDNFPALVQKVCTLRRLCTEHFAFQLSSLWCSHSTLPGNTQGPPRPSGMKSWLQSTSSQMPLLPERKNCIVINVHIDYHVQYRFCLYTCVNFNNFFKNKNSLPRVVACLWRGSRSPRKDGSISFHGLPWLSSGAPQPPCPFYRRAFGKWKRRLFGTSVHTPAATPNGEGAAWEQKGFH